MTFTRDQKVALERLVQDELKKLVGSWQVPLKAREKALVQVVMAVVKNLPEKES